MFDKKVAIKKLQTLSEKEIQEKLYGLYLSSDMVGEPKPKNPGANFQQAPEALKSNINAITASRRDDDPEQTLKDEFSDFISENISEPLNKFWQFITKLPRPVFYWVGGSAGILGLLILAFPVLNGGRSQSEETIMHRNPVMEAAARPEVRTEPAVPTAPSETAPPETPPLTPAPGGNASKAYSVQLCISNDIEATRKLITNLEAKGYQAYMRNVRGSQGNPIYQIFVGRYASHSEADGILSKLRQDSQFKTYDDSFVRILK